MKKFFYSMLLLAVAGMTAMTFVSCEEVNEEAPKPEEPKEGYFHFQYWISNDALELTDVTVTGIDGWKLDTDASFDNVPGKLADIEFTGQQGVNPKFSIKVTLKSNWKELLSKKEEFAGFQTWGSSFVKGEELYGFVPNWSGGSMSRENVDNALFEEMVAACVERKLGYER